MGWVLVLIVAGFLIAFLMRSANENSYRRGYEDALKERNRQGSIDVDYEIVESEDKKQ